MREAKERILKAWGKVKIVKCPTCRIVQYWDPHTVGKFCDRCNRWLDVRGKVVVRKFK
jgi:hypothetical protein